VLGAAAGAFAVVGVLAFVVETTDDDPTTPGVLLTLVLFAAALLLGVRASGPVRAACVTVLVLAVPLLWLFGLFGDGGVGRGEVRGVFLLTLASYAALYLLGWTRGRAVLLAGALLLFASWLSFEVADTGSSVVPFQSELVGSGRSAGSDLGVSGRSSSFTTSDDSSDATATVALVVGLAYLGTGSALDRRRLAGAATPFVAIGALETLAGAIVLGTDESALLGGVLAIVAGAVVGLVGGRGDRRRATTWIGVLAVFGGCVAVIADIAPGSAAAVGGIAFAFAIGLGALAVWLAPVLGEPDDGDDAPPEGDPDPMLGTAA
jgi:hypothetical protein